MYEANLIPADGFASSGQGAVGAEGMRPLSWGELVARLDAARDFRRMIRSRLHAGGGSFAFSCAAHLAAFGEGQPGINPIALANGKASEGSLSAVNRDETTGDRGRV